jgi:hypothetical protein
MNFIGQLVLAGENVCYLPAEQKNERYGGKAGAFLSR